MAKKFFIFHIILYFIVDVTGQKEDNIWLMGNAAYGNPTPDYFWDPFQFNFNVDPMQLEYTKREWDFSGMCTSLCDENGNMYCYSNGMFIVDSTDQWIKGGEVIGYNQYWKDNKEYLGDGKYFYNGLLIPQGNIMLPWPGKKDLVLYFAGKFDYFAGVNELIKCTIDKNRQNGSGEVIKKDETVLKAQLSEDGLQAVRHANGRDWWLVVEGNNADTFYTFYINPDTMLLHNITTTKFVFEGFKQGNNMFSLQGNEYASIKNSFNSNKAQLLLFDFNRATGILSNPKSDKMPGGIGEIGYGVIFSPEGKYLYANSGNFLYQYDLTKDDFPKKKKLIAKYDGFTSYPSDSLDPIKTTFGYWQHGPDGKFYNVSGFGRSKHMHRMEYPDEEGIECQFTQHAIHTPNNPWTIPNFPNFRLGPLDGSPADTLGLDNNPIAKFRYEADTTDHLKVRFTDLSYFRPEKWHWDFGDGTFYNGKKPEWIVFPKNSTYNVCLTVSNENSSNTTCRLVTIGTTSTDGIEAEGIGRKEVVSIFPNPTEGPLLVTLSEYIPEKANFILYDMMGREVMKSRIYYGWNNYDLSNLSVGNYIYIVMDKDQKIGQGKVVRL
jgi:PKD repeat protein